MIRVLGVDPGSVSGWALLEAWPGGSAVIKYGSVRTDHGLGASQVIAQWAHVVDTRPTLAIEGQFVPRQGGKGGKERAQAVDALKTAMHAGGWLYLAESMRWDIYRHSKAQIGIPPQTWRTAIYGSCRGWSSEKFKAHAIWAAKAVHGVELPATKHHVAEAIHIAQYAANGILSMRPVGAW